jgi:hypothetical protein
MSVGLVALTVGVAAAQAGAQASAIPSAADTPMTNIQGRGRELMQQMVEALGGAAWMDRKDWEIEGRQATFYEGKPHDEVPQFEEYYRLHPFGERDIIITHFGVFIATNHRDIADVWTADNGYEVTFKGTNPLPAKDVAEYQRRRAHSLDTVVMDWMKQPDIDIEYDGPDTESRHLTDKISLFTVNDDSVTLELDAGTHLPLSLSYQWRDPLYKDFNTDVTQFDDYHVIQGIETPFAVTQLHNGEMVSQRFVTKVAYNLNLPADLFDPNRPLTKNTKK